MLSNRGYDVEQKPSPKPNGKKPDYKIEGEYFDCFAPDTDTPVTNIRKTLEGKLAKGQADRFVVNAKDWGGDVADIGPDIARHSRGIKEVIVVDRAGRVVHVYP